MKTGLLLILSMPAHATLTVGQPAPDFTATDSNGKQHQLSQYRGKTVVLEWTSHECPYVVKHYGSGNMQKLQQEATANGIIWLSIISSKPGKQGHIDGTTANQLTASRNASPTAVILDETSEVGELYGAKTTPHMYIIDKDGQLVYMGGIDNIPSADPGDIAKAKNYVRAALDDMAAGRPVSENITRPYGCSVKY